MTDTPTLWRDMTPEEKGALLLAYHDDEPIECYDCAGFWFEEVGPVFYGSLAYRIKPEPKREMVNAKLCITSDGTSYHMEPHLFAGHYGDDYFYFFLTFDTIDGKPDPASIKIEKL